MNNIQNTTLNTGEKIGLVSNLSTMLSAGIPILEVVDSLLEDAKGGMKKVLEVTKNDLIEGHRLHTSFSKFPKVFDKVTVNIIKASEEAGTLEIALKDLRASIQRDVEFNDKIKSALIYPLFILGTFFAVLIFMLVMVIPKVASVFRNLRIDLPLPTKIMVFVSEMITKNIFLVAIIVGVIIVLFIFLFKTKRALILNIFYSLPLVSKVVRYIDLTRFSRSMHLLLNSGLPIIECLDLTQDVVIKHQMTKVINDCKKTVSSGKTLSEGLKVSRGYIPPIMVKLVEAGEKTGTLDKSMLDISVYFDYQVTGALKTVTALIEPIMLLLIGVVVGGMMLSIIGPIYNLIGQVGGR